MAEYDTFTLQVATFAAGPPATLTYTIVMSGTGLTDRPFPVSGGLVSDTATGAVLQVHSLNGPSDSVTNPPIPAGGTVGSGLTSTIDFTDGGNDSIADTITIKTTETDTSLLVTPSGGGSHHQATVGSDATFARSILEDGFMSLEDSDAGLTDPYFIFAGGITACLHEDTMIETNNGLIAIKELARGDLVRTYQDGYQPISRVLTSPTYGACTYVVIKKHALSPCVPSEDLMLTTGHPIKYGDRYITAGGLAQAKHLKSGSVYIERVSGGCNYNLQFDKHYTFCANGVETQSIPTTTSYRGLALPEDLFHDKSLYDASKIGDESTYLHRSEKDLVLPLTKEDVEAFKSIE